MVRILGCIAVLILGIGISGCEHRAEILMLPLADGDLTWVQTESDVHLLAEHIEDEAKWLLAQAIARAECVSAAAYRAPEVVVRHTTAPNPLIKTVTPPKNRGPRRIDLNTASMRELQRLPRVGPVLAQAIIDARPYHSIHDIRRVKGVGAKTFEAMEPMLSVSGADED